jgi:hypothetical protein
VVVFSLAETVACQVLVSISPSAREELLPAPEFPLPEDPPPDPPPGELPLPAPSPPHAELPVLSPAALPVPDVDVPGLPEKLFRHPAEEQSMMIVIITSMTDKGRGGTRRIPECSGIGFLSLLTIIAQR